MTDIHSIVSGELPSQIDFNIEGKTLVIQLRPKGLIENMQSDPAAFEGWAMCLKANYPKHFSNVVIQWEPLDIGSLSPSERGHYYRFLYRADKFQTNYPDWVSICPSVPQSVIDEIPQWVLNYPGKDSTESEKENPNAESHLERRLLSLMRNHFSVANHQLPVGLFYKTVSSKTEYARTSRGLSQIDLWSLDNDVLTVYELKNDVNISVGIVSEVQFYANVINDLVCHRVNYPSDFFKKKKHYRDTEKLAAAIYLSNRIKKVNGVLLADKLHPFVTNEVISLLATNKSGIGYSAVSVQDFEKELLK